MCVLSRSVVSAVHGILQARILEWVAISSSRAIDSVNIHMCVLCHVLCTFHAVEHNILILLFFFGGHRTCRILIPQPGIEPIPSAVKAQSPNY